MEQAVLEFALEQPTWGQVRVANEVRKRAVTLSPAGMRCVWMRHGLRSTKERLRALEAKAAQDGVLLTESQVARWNGRSWRRNRTGSSRASAPATAGRRTRSTSAR
jgi:hypothetical protein